MAWLGTWANRIEVEIDNTNIDSDLTHFPVLIKLGHSVGQDGQDTGCVFDDLTTNSLKLAVTDEDGTTELYVEVEKWDNTVPEAWLWASSSTFITHASRPTKIFLYYDASQDDNTTYVGVPGSAPGELVWDADYVMVQHMPDGADNQHITDSTSHDLDGLKGVADEPTEIAGKIGEAQDFDGGDHINIPGILGLFDPMAAFTLEAIVNDNNSDGAVVGEGDVSDAVKPYAYMAPSSSQLSLYCANDAGTVISAVSTDAPVSYDTWHHIAITGDGVTTYLFYVDGDGHASTTDTMVGTFAALDQAAIGARVRAAVYDVHFTGQIDEVRMSSTERSAAWLKATKQTCWDNLCTYNFCGDWLQAWKNRITLTIDSSLVDSNLTHFPVMIRLSNKCGASEQDLTRVFDEVGEEYQKIAVTDDTGTQQLYVEVEYWSAAVGAAILWVSRADWVVSSSADTTIYLYFDSDKDDNTYFVDVHNSTPAERVWDSSFLMVQHMQDGASNAATYDSTSNNNDGAKLGANEPIEATGKIGDAQDFDNNDDFIETAAPVIPTTDFTLSALVNVDDFATYQAVIGQIDAVEAGRLQFLIEQTTGKIYLQITTAEVSDSAITAAVWQGVDVTRSGSAVTFYKNGDPDGTATLADAVSQDDVLEIGRATANRMLGLIDEVRVSNVARSAAWLKAKYNTCFDSLITFSTETAKWKAGWDNRIKLTVSKTNIDEALLQFPVMIRISASCGASSQDMTRVFDENGVEDLKIAVTEGDGETELYVEVEKWDNTNEEAILWVARDDFYLSSVVDTTLYLYYDADHADNNTYVGVPGSGPGELVWDSYFVLVDHMQDNPNNTATMDSTSNDNDGTKKGAAEPTEIAGKVGEAQDFEDSGDDYIGYGVPAELNIRTLTYEAIVYPTTLDATAYLMVKGDDSGFADFSIRLGFVATGKIWFSGSTGAAAAFSLISDDNNTVALNTWQYLAAVANHDEAYARSYIDAVLDKEDTSTGVTQLNAAFDFTVGARKRLGIGSYDGPYGGIADEIRISNVVRTVAWLKATKHICFDNMVTFTIEGETVPLVKVDFAWDSAAMADTPTWWDVSPDVREYSFKKGREHQLDRESTGTGIIHLGNDKGYYWPDKRKAPWYGYVTAGVRVRIRCIYDGTLYPRFVGFTDEWLPQWVSVVGSKLPYMVVSLTDGIEHFALTVINSAAEVAELSSTRVGNIADAAGWPNADRDLQAGSETMMNTGALVNENAKSHLDKVQESELGLLFIAFNGDLTFHGRGTRQAAPYTTPQATFGDDEDEEEYVQLSASLDKDLLHNEARFTRTGGVEQTSEDATSQLRYGKRTLVKTGLYNSTDNAVAILTDYVVARHKNADKLRVKSLEILPGGDAANLYPKVFTYDISTRICCRLNQAKVDSDYFIESVEESAAANELMWRTSWQLSDAEQQYWTPGARTDILRPNAAGDKTEWDQLVGAATHWQAVAETPVNDATYIWNESLGGANPTDLYNFPSLPAASTTITSVTMYYRTKLLSPPVSGQMSRPILKVGGNEYQGAWETPTAGWTTKSETWALSPDTGLAWTLIEVNAMQAGLEANEGAPADGDDPACSWLYLSVINTADW